jgi:hypothetical protein
MFYKKAVDKNEKQKFDSITGLPIFVRVKIWTKSSKGGTLL